MTTAADRLPRRAFVGFGLGSLGAGVYSTVPTVLLLFYCTEILHLAPAVAAIIVFVPKVWAILWDPFVGVWSDRGRSSHGRRAPFILAGAIGVTVTFVLLFNAPDAAGSLTVLYVMTVYFLMATTYSLFAVPYVAIPAEISPVASERERLMLWRMVFAMIGVLVGAGAAPHLVELAGGGKRGYGVMAWVVAAACGLAMAVTFFTVRLYHTSDRDTTQAPQDAQGGLKRILRNREYLRLWVSYVLALSGASLFLAMVPYFVTRVMGRAEGDAGTALFAVLIATIVSLPLWSKLLRVMGGWAAYGLAMLGYAAVAGLFILLPHGISLTAAAALFFALGITFGGLQLLPFTLLAHIAHADAQFGVRQEGLYTGIWTAGEKLALAIGPAMAGLGLAVIGYVSGVATQSAATLQGLQVIMAFGPTLFLLPGMALVFRRPALSVDQY